jgi:hypothetical protein
MIQFLPQKKGSVLSFRKNRLVNAVERNYVCLLQESNGTYKYTVRTKYRTFSVKRGGTFICH